MEGQIEMSDFLKDDNYISEKAYEEAKAEREKINKARNRAISLLEDAVARYRKEKTRSRSRKLAMEKDSLLTNPRFEVLKEYERRDDIQESYGWDLITEKERDRLEELWDERENIKNKSIDGIYVDDVTKVLGECISFALDWKEEELNEVDATIKKFEEMRNRDE